MEKRFNFRIYPNKAQEEQIRKNFGCVRFVYNYFLSKRMEKYNAGKGIYTYYEASKDLTVLKKTEGYAWLKEADSHSLQNALKDMNFAFSQFYRRTREKNAQPGFPRFKKKGETRQSYMSQAQIGRNGVPSIAVLEKTIKLPKLGFVACRVSKPISGRILSANVFQVPSGKYFVSVCCTDIEQEAFPQTGKEITLHVGTQSLTVSSEMTQKKISRLHRHLSRKPRGSANYEKARVTLAKAHERVKNQKTDMLQKLSTQLVRDHDLICIRKAELEKMREKSHFTYHLWDTSWGEFVKMLKYKCNWYGKTLVEVPGTQDTDSDILSKPLWNPGNF
ncbi:transposase [Clostridia bacterium]|nr:transposase [Clostridia bacterium]